MQLYRKRHIFKNFPVAGLLNFSWRKQGLLHSNEEICTRPGIHRTSKGSSFLADIAWMKTNRGLQLWKQKIKKNGKSLYGGREGDNYFMRKKMDVCNFCGSTFCWKKISFYLGREQLLAAQLQCWLCDNFESECRKNFPLILSRKRTSLPWLSRKKLPDADNFPNFPLETFQKGDISRQDREGFLNNTCRV